MRTQPPGPRAYTRAEYVSDAVVHVAGLAFAALAVPALIVTAALDPRATRPRWSGTSVYGLALILMLGCSALYNMLRRPDWCLASQAARPFRDLHEDRRDLHALHADLGAGPRADRRALGRGARGGGAQGCGRGAVPLGGPRALPRDGMGGRRGGRGASGGAAGAGGRAHDAGRRALHLRGGRSTCGSGCPSTTRSGTSSCWPRAWCSSRRSPFWWWAGEGDRGAVCPLLACGQFTPRGYFRLDGSLRGCARAAAVSRVRGRSRRSPAPCVSLMPSTALRSARFARDTALADPKCASSARLRAAPTPGTSSRGVAPTAFARLARCAPIAKRCASSRRRCTK